MENKRGKKGERKDRRQGGEKGRRGEEVEREKKRGDIQNGGDKRGRIAPRTNSTILVPHSHLPSVRVM
jgi:hypothetical protein